MIYILYIIAGLILFFLVFTFVIGPKSLLRFSLYARRMWKLYEQNVVKGYDNFHALVEVAKARHPELSDTIHERLVTKFNELGALINFIYWGLEEGITSKGQLTDERAQAIIESGRVELQRGGYKVFVGEDLRGYGQTKRRLSVSTQWLQYLPNDLRPPEEKVHVLEKLRKKYHVDHHTFAMRISSSPATTRRVQENVYRNAKQAMPIASEKEILRAVLFSRCNVPFGAGLEMSEREIDDAMENIDSLDDLIEFILAKEKSLYDIQQKRDMLGIGKRIDDILSR